MVGTATCSEMKMGSISSEVERKTESNVPIEMRPPAYRLDAAAEKPHWGTTPTRAPITGPKGPLFARSEADLSSVFRSSASIRM